MAAGSPKIPVRFDKVQKYFGPVKVLEQFAGDWRSDITVTLTHTAAGNTSST